MKERTYPKIVVVMALNLFVDSAGVQVTEQIGFETQRDLFALTF